MRELATMPEHPMVRRALILLVASASLFGLMAFTAKLAAARLSGSQIAMVRFAIAILPVLLVPRYRRSASRIQRWDLLAYRGVFGGAAVLLYFLAIAKIPLGLATLLNYTAPLFSGIFAAVFIGEAIRRQVFIPLVIAFLGVLLVVRGHSLPEELIGFGRWELLGLTSGMLSGAAVTAIRVARRTEGSWSIYASFSICGLLATLPFAIATWKNPTAIEWVLLSGVGIFSIGAQLLMTYAFRWVETLIQGVISQLAVVISMVLGVVLLGEKMTGQILAGSSLTIGGVVAVMFISSRPRPVGFVEPAEQ